MSSVDLDLWRKIEMFQGTKMTISKKIKHDGVNNFFSGSIYLMAIGANDYINNYLLSIMDDSWKYNPYDFIVYPVSTLGQQPIASFTEP